MASRRGGGFCRLLSFFACSTALEASARAASMTNDGTMEEPAPACTFLRGDAATGIAQRWFDFEGERRAALRGYRLRYAPFVLVRGTVWPFARSRCDGLSRFALRLGYERIFGVESVLGGVVLDTSAFAYGAELQYDVPIAPFTLTPRAGFVYRHYELGRNVVPDAKYELLAFGSDGALRLGWFLGELGLRAQLVLAAGSLDADDWFPHASGFGYQTHVLAGATPADWLELFVLAEFESYSFALGADEPGRYPLGRADSAYDHYVRLGVGARFIVPER